MKLRFGDLSSIEYRDHYRYYKSAKPSKAVKPGTPEAGPVLPFDINQDLHFDSRECDCGLCRKESVRRNYHILPFYTRRQE